MLAIRFMPVSYTHLDVYKRQALDGALAMELDDFDGLADLD